MGIRRDSNSQSGGETNPHDDYALIRSTAAGDCEAFQMLWTRHVPWVSAMAREYSRDADDAEDLVQKIAMRVLKAAAQFSPSGSVAAWIRSIVRSVGIDHARANARLARGAQQADLIDFVPDDRFTPTTAFQLSVLRSELREAIESLPDTQRTTVIMRYFGSMSLSDIAWATHVPVGTVKSRLSLSLKKIRDRICAEQDSQEE